MANVGGVAGERLRSFIQRIERLEEEKKTIGVDIREVFAEAKSSGFDPKTMRKVLRLRKQNEAERQEEQALLETYLAALGMTPIEEAIANAQGGEPGSAPPAKKPAQAAAKSKPKAKRPRPQPNTFQNLAAP